MASLRPVYTAQLLCQSIAAGDTLITAPSNAKLVMRDLLINETSGVNGSLLILYGPNHVTVYAWQRTAADPLAVWNWQGRACIEVGQSVSFHVVSGTWNVWCTGYILATP